MSRIRIVYFVTASALACLLAFVVVRPVHAAGLTAMTFNTKHGGEAPWSTSAQIAEIVAERPDVVMLQEVDTSQLEQYVNGINAGLHTTEWHGEYAQHCTRGTAPECSNMNSEAVMVLTHLPIVDVEKRLMWASDQYLDARGVIRVAVRLDDGTTLQVFASHLPATGEARAARVEWTRQFLPWARSFAGPRLIGGDFNDKPGTAPITAMRQEYTDAFAAKGSGPDATHTRDDKHYTSHIDYLFSAGGLSPQSAFVPQVTLSDHRPVVATFTTATPAATNRNAAVAAQTENGPASTTAAATVTGIVGATTARGDSSAAPTPAAAASSSVIAGEEALLDDNFDAGVIDVKRWPLFVFSGYQDARIAVAATGGALQITPLAGAAGISRYNGIGSGPYDMTAGGYASAQLVQGPVGSGSFAMFTVGSDGDNFYRIYQGGAADARLLMVEKKIAGTKSALATLPYSVDDDQYLRIRRDYRPQDTVDDVVFEASPSATGYVELFREPWDPLVTASALMFEMKGGTSAPVADPGTIVWDNFHAARVSGS